MKHTLLLFFLFIFCLTAASAQSSFSDRLTIRSLQQNEKAELQIYPNPAVDYIGISKNKVVKEIRVFNLVGHEMKSFTAVDGEKYYIGDLPRGMYLIQLIGDSKKIITTQRVNKR